jgi:SAM-dependent methyltransferase
VVQSILPSENATANRGFYFRSLNVGCGSDLWGDVRIDISLNFLMLHCKPTVIASAQNLPFRDGCFEDVKCSHVLEHLENPFEALDELLRVAKKAIFLSFPTEYDVLPWIVVSIFPIPDFSTLRMALLTRKRRLHVWLVSPKSVIQYFKKRNWLASCALVKISLLRSLESGRKGKYFQWATRYFAMPYEYSIKANKRENRATDEAAT